MNDEELKKQLDRIEKKAGKAAGKDDSWGCFVVVLLLLFLGGCFKHCGYNG
jgi:hypothetical protein